MHFIFSYSVLWVWVKTAVAPWLQLWRDPPRVNIRPFTVHWSQTWLHKYLLHVREKAKVSNPKVKQKETKACNFSVLLERKFNQKCFLFFTFSLFHILWKYNTTFVFKRGTTVSPFFLPCDFIALIVFIFKPGSQSKKSWLKPTTVMNHTSLLIEICAHLKVKCWEDLL